MIHELLKNFKEKTDVSTATILNNNGTIIATENNKFINLIDYCRGINNAWKVINKLAKDKDNKFDFYKDIEILSFQLEAEFNKISYGVLIKSITDNLILLTIFRNASNVSLIITEFRKILRKLRNYYLDRHIHLYI